jgi:hypothetical protein
VEGLSGRLPVWLEIRSDRTARERIQIEAGDAGGTTEKLIALDYARLLDVHVTREDTRKPVAGALVVVTPSLGARPRGYIEPTSKMTDTEGRAIINPYAGERFMIVATPPPGEAYVPRRSEITWPGGSRSRPHLVEIKLKPGIPVHGMISEKPSGNPVPGAVVRYEQTSRDNPFYVSYRRLGLLETATKKDGNFTIVVPPGKGHLLVFGPTADYLHLQTNNLELGVSGLPVSQIYPDAMVHLDLRPGEQGHEASMRLKRGVTVRGRIAGPDGTAVARAYAIGRSYVDPGNRGGPVGLLSAFRGPAPRILVRDGQFEIPGCDPEKPYTFYFLDTEHQFGAMFELSGKSVQEGPVTVSLQKCGTATVRCLDRQGKPIANLDARPLMLIITPGVDGFDPAERNQVMSDFTYQDSLDYERQRDLHAEPDGRVTFVSLIPGAHYRFYGHDFMAEAGKTLDLGQMVIDRPQFRRPPSKTP